MTTFEEWYADMYKGLDHGEWHKYACMNTWNDAFAAGRKAGLLEAAEIADAQDVDCGCGVPCDCFGPRYLLSMAVNAIRAKAAE